MKNGECLTGAITSVMRSRLRLATDYAGELAIRLEARGQVFIPRGGSWQGSDVRIRFEIPLDLLQAFGMADNRDFVTQFQAGITMR